MAEQKQREDQKMIKNSKPSYLKAPKLNYKLIRELRGIKKSFKPDYLI